MTDDELSDPELLRLETRVAIAVVPLISRAVAFLDHRQMIVTDIVRCWLALPEHVKAHYTGIGAPRGHGITYFGWDYVDLVEADAEPSGEVGSDELPEEHFVCQRWGDRLDRILENRGTSAAPDREWLVKFPLDLDDERAVASGASSAA